MNARAISERLDKLSDGELVQRAQAGERDAFASLYDRYFDRVYDFLTRMMRNRGEAEDVTQDTFIRAMNSIGSLQSGGSFKSWIFTIARNTALNRIERNSRVRPMPVSEDDSGESLDLDIVDTDRLGNPEEAAQATAVASLVWEAASGLNPNQYSLLDLHLRQGLESGDIADVLDITRNNAYVMLNRMKAALAETVTAYIMMNEGRLSCPDLDDALNRASISRFTPAARRVVSKHIGSCTRCQDHQSDLVSPLAILGALAPAPAAMGVRESIREQVLEGWPAQSDTQAESNGSGNGIDAQMLASLAAIVTGIVILVTLVTTSILDAGDAAGAPGLTTQGIRLTVTNDDGGPLPGVAIQLYGRDAATPVFEAITGDDGSVEWPEAVEGDYDVIVDGLPDGIALSDTDRVLPISIVPGEQLILTATLRTTAN